jgi:hypothetical protein
MATIKIENVWTEEEIFKSLEELKNSDSNYDLKRMFELHEKLEFLASMARKTLMVYLLRAGWNGFVDYQDNGDISLAEKLEKYR